MSGSSTGLTPFEVGPKKTRGARIASRASFLEIQALKTLLEDSCETDVVKLKELAKKRPKACRICFSYSASIQYYFNIEDDTANYSYVIVYFFAVLEYTYIYVYIFIDIYL